MDIKRVGIMLLTTLIISATSLFLGFYISDSRNHNKIGNLNAQIVAMDSTIIEHKKVVATLQEKLKVSEATIPASKAKAKSSKATAEEALSLINAPDLSQKVELAFRDSERLTLDLEDALAICRQTTEAQDVVIKDQDREIGLLKSEVDKISQECQKQTTRKKWYRAGFLGACAVIAGLLL